MSLIDCNTKMNKCLYFNRGEKHAFFVGIVLFSVVTNECSRECQIKNVVMFKAMLCTKVTKMQKLIKTEVDDGTIHRQSLSSPAFHISVSTSNPR